MTYRELLYKATRLCDKGEITLGEYEEMTKPLDRDVEQEPILDNIRSEIEQEYNRLRATRADETLELGECLGLKMSLKIIDKYREQNEKNMKYKTIDNPCYHCYTGAIGECAMIGCEYLYNSWSQDLECETVEILNPQAESEVKDDI